jgi:LPXTG-motif cell wall-anchored protein
VVGGVQVGPQAQEVATAENVANLPSTSTNRNDGLIALGSMLIVIGGLLMRRKPVVS